MKAAVAPMPEITSAAPSSLEDFERRKGSTQNDEETEYNKSDIVQGAFLVIERFTYSNSAKILLPCLFDIHGDYLLSLIALRNAKRGGS
jgi:hypothetical protein